MVPVGQLPFSSLLLALFCALLTGHYFFSTHNGTISEPYSKIGWVAAYEWFRWAGFSFMLSLFPSAAQELKSSLELWGKIEAKDATGGTGRRSCISIFRFLLHFFAVFVLLLHRVYFRKERQRMQWWARRSFTDFPHFPAVFLTWVLLKPL